MEAGPILVFGVVDLVCALVCFQKGKTTFGWLGLSALIPFLLPLGVFGVVGALRYAKPNSSWARSQYGPGKMAIALRRFPGEGATPARVQPRATAPTSVAAPEPAQGRPDTGPLGPGPAIGDAEAGVIRRFLDRAGADKVINLQTRLQLVGYLEELRVGRERTEVEAAPSDPVRAPVIPRPTPPAKHLPPVVPPTMPPPPVAKTPPPAPRPNPLTVAIAKAWEALASDIALHGFAYLGVVLTFVGVLGFLFFAFADLPNAAQPFVELFIAFVFFGWAWMLRRQKVEQVADGMELIGGMVLPLIVFAGLVDGAPFPPDFTDAPLVAALGISSVLIAVAYAGISARKPQSTLRFLVAPLIWLAAMTLGFAFKTDEPLASVAITHLVSAQPALASAAVALTLVASRARRDHRLSSPTVRSALVGVPAAYLLTLSLSVGEGWTLTWPIALLGVSTLVSFEVLAVWFNRSDFMILARPLLVAGVLAPLAPSLGGAWTGLVATVFFLGLNEWQRRRQPDATAAILMTMGGALAGLVLSLGEPWTALVGFTLASVWAHLHQRDDLPGAEKEFMTAAAAVLPLGVVYALGGLWGLEVAWLAMGGVVSVLAVAVRWLRNEESFWAYWLLGAGVVVGLGATAHWSSTGTGGLMTGATLLLVSVSLSIGPRWPAGRSWFSAVAAAAALAVVLDSLEVTLALGQLIWAIAGLVVVIAASLWRHFPASHLAAVGLITTSLTVASLAAGGDPAPVLGAWALAWLASAFADEIGGETFTGLLTRVLGKAISSTTDDGGAVAGWVVPAFLVASVPPALITFANRWAEFEEHRSWTGITMTVLGVAYALLARPRGLRRRLRSTLGVAAIASSVVGVSVAAPDPWPTILASAGVVGVAALLSRDLRRTWFVWLAWLMATLTVLLLAGRVGVPGGSLHQVGLVWGGALLAGGLVADDLRSGRRARGEGLRTAWLRYPVLLGGLVVPVSLGPALVAGPNSYRWWALGAAVGYMGVAGLIRIGAVSAPAYALAALGVAGLSPRSLTEEPWLFVILAAPMVAVSWLVERRQSGSNADFFRWDLAPLIVAHGIGLLALAFAFDGGGLAATALAFGILSVAVGLWRRNRLWVEAGNLLIVLAAWDIGLGWFALALGATSLRGMLGTALGEEESRHHYQAMAVSAAGVAWPTFLAWSNLEAATAANTSILAFGACAFVVAGLNRWWTLRRDTGLWWGGLTVIGAATTVLLAVAPNGPGVDGPWFALGLASLGSGLEFGANRDGKGLRAGAVVTIGLAWVTLLIGLGVTPPESYSHTALAFGGLALGAAVMGRLQRAAPSNAIRWGGLGVAGVLTAAVASGSRLGGSLFEGPEFGLGLALMAAGLDIGWKFTDHKLRYAAMAGAAASWTALALGLGWTATTAASWTAGVFGVLVLAVPEMVRFSLGVRSGSQMQARSSNLARAWAALGAAGVFIAAGITYVAGDVRVGGYWIAASLALLSLAAIRGATPLGLGGLRETSVLAALASIITFAYTAGWPELRTASLILVSAAAATLGSLWLWRLRPASAWIRPLIVLGNVGNAVTAALALGELPGRSLLVAVLLSVGGQAIAVGLTRGLRGWLATGPPLLGVASVLSVAESVGGSAQWYAVPLGLVLLSEVEILRSLKRFSGGDGDSTLIVVLEWVGLGILIAPPLVEVFTVSPVAGLMALAAAAAVFIWGVATRVRRRVVAAAAIVLATLVLTLFAAAAGSAPDSAFFWIVAIGIGFAVMLVAGFVEAYRSKKGRTIARLDQLMEGWE